MICFCFHLLIYLLRSDASFARFAPTHQEAANTVVEEVFDLAVALSGDPPIPAEIKSRLCTRKHFKLKVLGHCDMSHSMN